MDYVGYNSRHFALGLYSSADIDKSDFMIMPEQVKDLVNDRTQAILVADIFGQSANYEALSKLAKKHSLKIISDTAQAPYASTPLGLLEQLQTLAELV